MAVSSSLATSTMRVLVSSPIVTARICTVLLMALLAPAAPAAAQAVVRAITVSTVGSEAVVTIEATGVLPAPTLGALDGPPRIFLDFADVRARTPAVARSADARIRRVRVGLFSANPIVTRIVIDLQSQQPHRVELATGRVMVFVGSAAPPSPVPALPPAAATTSAPSAPRTPPAAPPAPSREPTTAPRTTPNVDARNPAPRPASTTVPAPPAAANAAIPPVPDLPPPMPEADATRTPARSSSPNAATSAPRVPYRPPAPPPPSKDLEKYRAVAGNVLDRLRLQIPLLGWMESLDDEQASRMPAALEEFDRLRDELTAIKPPESVRAQHDMLLQGARLGSTSARLRLEAVQSGNSALRRNAASAAAGAALMLERAFTELGLSSVDR
jgi:hypothetical protein